MNKERSIELNHSADSAKLIIDGHDLSAFATEVRIVLKARSTPRVEVDLIAIDDLKVRLEKSGLVLNVHNPSALKIEEAYAPANGMRIASPVENKELPSGMSDPRL